MQAAPGPPHTPSLVAFTKRAAVALGLAAALFLTWQLSNVILLVFAAVIVAVLLRAIADPVIAHTRLRANLAVPGAALLVCTGVGLAAWVGGGVISHQARELTDRLPRSAAEVRLLFDGAPFLAQLATEIATPASLTSNLNGLAGRLGGYALSAVGAAANVLLVLVAGMFLAMDAGNARDGLLSLAPASARHRLAAVLNGSGRALRRWLLGTLADMIVVGVLTGVGAAVVGLPSAAVLGLIAGLATFVPILGPVAGAAPGILAAMPLGWGVVGWTVAMYVAVQQIEGNFIYPFIQRRALALPPYLTLFAVAVFGALFGVLGVMLATPLLVVIVIATREARSSGATGG